MRKSGTFYWIIGLTKIENMVNWAEANKPMDANLTRARFEKVVKITRHALQIARKLLDGAY